MNTYKVIFLDIDGTILKPDHTYEDSVKEAIGQAQKQGIEVFLATGRPLHELAELAEELNISSFIGYNGALAIYENKIVLDEPMDEKTVSRFLATAEKHDHEAVLYTSESNYYTDMASDVVKQFIEAFQVKKNRLFTPDISSHVLGATLMGLSEQQVSLYEGDPSYHFTQVNVEGLTHCYDVIRDTVNKGRAIETLLKILGIPKEQSIAFGDGMNDREMLRSVGRGFAMGNCHPDLLAYASDTTTAVDDSGIFNGLKSLGIVK